MRHRTFPAVFAVVVASLVAAAGLAAGVQTVRTSVPLSAQTQVEASATNCENNPGPYVTLTGEIAFGGLAAQLIFRNNAKGTHTHVEETRVSVVLTPEDGTIQIPKQPVLGGVGGNPFIWLQWVDASGNALSGEIFLGRCVQGLSGADAVFSIPADATVEVAAEGCENNPGPYITLTGEMSLSGVNARLIFRNNDNPVGGPHEADEAVTVDIVVIPEGETIRFAKQPVLGGVGGNPWISLVFVDADGNPVSKEYLLGRCVQDF